MKVVIPGGSGQVGTVLARALHHEGHDVVVLSRRPEMQPWRVVGWDGVSIGDWAQELNGSDAVINLAGRSVNCRYTAANRREILESRVLSTQLVGQAIALSARPPRVWLQASTATIYAHRYDAPNDEASGLVGGAEPSAPSTWRFSIDVARAWEAAFDEAVVPGTRKVTLRSAIMLSPDRGGAFDTLLGLVRLGLGGTAGDGRQFVSWIHDEDFVAAVRWLIARDDVEGVVNVASPNPAAERRVHARLARGRGSDVRTASDAIDARDRRRLHADRDRTRPEEPSCCSGPATRPWLWLQISRLARCGTRPLPALAARSVTARPTRRDRHLHHVPRHSSLRATHRTLR